MACSSVRAQMGPANDVEVTMALALHSVWAKIGQNTKSIDGEGAPHVNCHSAQPGHQAAAPHLQLAHVLFWYHQQHQGNPGKLVDDNYDLLVQVPYTGRGPVSDDLTEYTVGRTAQAGLLSNS